MHIVCVKGRLCPRVTGRGKTSCGVQMALSSFAFSPERPAVPARQKVVGALPEPKRLAGLSPEATAKSQPNLIRFSTMTSVSRPVSGRSAHGTRT